MRYMYAGMCIGGAIAIGILLLAPPSLSDAGGWASFLGFCVGATFTLFGGLVGTYIGINREMDR